MGVKRTLTLYFYNQMDDNLPLKCSFSQYLEFFTFRLFWVI